MVTSEAFKSATTKATDTNRNDSAYAPSYTEPVSTGENRGISPDRRKDGKGELSKKNPGKPEEIAVARAGVEPATHGFSIRCSTN